MRSNRGRPSSQKSRPELDPFYYLEHFHEMLAFVEGNYGHALDVEHRRFINKFKTLSHASACTYVRLVNRKNTLFKPSALVYAELSNITLSIAELTEFDFIRSANTDVFDDWLQLQRRDELQALLKACLPPSAYSCLKAYKLRKPELIDACAVNINKDSEIVKAQLSEYFVQCQVETLNYFLFLYFGKPETCLNAFTMRDLGLRNTRDQQQAFKARFDCLESAQSTWFFTQILVQIEQASDAELRQMAVSVANWPRAQDSDVEAIRDRAICKLGRQLERCSEPSAAIAVYHYCDVYPATERKVRLLYQQEGDSGRALAKQALQQMMDSPSCPEELVFAEDFYRRKYKHKRVGVLTKTLREAQTLRCDESGRGSPEESVAKVFRRRGYRAFHTENSVWTQLFGLLFWDLIYGDASQVLHSPFDRFPQELLQGLFYQRRESAIEQRLAILADPVAAKRLLIKTAAKHYGSPNAMVWWQGNVTDWAIELVERAPNNATADILRTMCQDYRRASKGFPDLMVVRGDSVEFVEVKAEGDQLKRHQLAQMQRLSDAGFSVSVMRVEWFVDPCQEYVVVDVETTGGKAQWHRVTEIGAVKMVGGEVIDRFQTLINPRRKIPHSIVQLTGISDEMVANAPIFGEISRAFRDFLGDAVFVAHNVNFDYGFLREEYRRLDQKFSYPKFCTVAGSRKYLPGHSSYSLKNLCHVYGIELETHHRALCDAEAAAQILCRINTQREASPPNGHGDLFTMASR